MFLTVSLCASRSFQDIPEGEEGGADATEAGKNGTSVYVMYVYVILHVCTHTHVHTHVVLQ